MTARALVGLVVGCAIALSAAPAFGDSEGTVSAQVTVAGPCIQVTPASLDFGSLGFSSDSNNPTGASRSVTATNCGPAGSVLARGSNATSTGGATWTLEVEPSALCSAPNRFMQRVSNGGASFALSATENTSIRALGAGEAAPLDAFVIMPCAGSSGAGQVMTFSYLFTAVAS